MEINGRVESFNYRHFSLSQVFLPCHPAPVGKPFGYLSTIMFHVPSWVVWTPEGSTTLVPLKVGATFRSVVLIEEAC